jgi:hypothetical protein
MPLSNFPANVTRAFPRAFEARPGERWEVGCPAWASGCRLMGKRLPNSVCGTRTHGGSGKARILRLGVGNMTPT